MDSFPNWESEGVSLAMEMEMAIKETVVVAAVKA